MASKIIHAAGGIVVRGGARRRFAVVQRSKDGSWVLPRGKLKRNERPIAGARREAVEETGLVCACMSFSARSPIEREAGRKSCNFGEWMRRYDQPGK